MWLIHTLFTNGKFIGNISITNLIRLKTILIPSKTPDSPEKNKQ